MMRCLMMWKVGQCRGWAGNGHLLSSGAVLEAVTVLSKHGYHRAGVAISRSRLGQDCDLLRKVMVRWVKQISSDGKYALAAKWWLAVEKS